MKIFVCSQSFTPGEICNPVTVHGETCRTKELILVREWPLPTFLVIERKGTPTVIHSQSSLLLAIGEIDSDLGSLVGVLAVVHFGAKAIMRRMRIGYQFNEHEVESAASEVWVQLGGKVHHEALAKGQMVPCWRWPAFTDQDYFLSCRQLAFHGTKSALGVRKIQGYRRSHCQKG